MASTPGSARAARAFSGGQGRRLALARALLSPAPILILDEPCAGLDAETERAFLATLNEVADGRTVILITHRLTGVEQLDRIWRLSGGQGDRRRGVAHYALFQDGENRQATGICHQQRREDAPDVHVMPGLPANPPTIAVRNSASSALVARSRAMPISDPSQPVLEPGSRRLQLADSRLDLLHALFQPGNALFHASIVGFAIGFAADAVGLGGTFSCRRG